MLLGVDGLKFWKVEFIGNYFLFICFEDIMGVMFEDVMIKFLELVIVMCCEYFSIGGDGFLVVGMEEGDVCFWMFNLDGIEDFCGNGICCVV